MSMSLDVTLIVGALTVPVKIAVPPEVKLAVPVAVRSPTVVLPLVVEAKAPARTRAPGLHDIIGGADPERASIDRERIAWPRRMADPHRTTGIRVEQPADGESAGTGHREVEVAARIQRGAAGNCDRAVIAPDRGSAIGERRRLAVGAGDGDLARRGAERRQRDGFEPRAAPGNFDEHVPALRAARSKLSVSARTRCDAARRSAESADFDPRRLGAVEEIGGEKAGASADPRTARTRRGRVAL
jgi:hypothetical protein